jgi:signal transduction histidine kinase
MKVDWQGKSSFMHVFFVNNDILLLEKAKSNIKLQKIMFASVSHEFRTPLNAIIHSYNLTKFSFDKLMTVVQSMLSKLK